MGNHANTYPDGIYYVDENEESLQRITEMVDIMKERQWFISIIPCDVCYLEQPLYAVVHQFLKYNNRLAIAFNEVITDTTPPTEYLDLRYNPSMGVVYCKNGDDCPKQRHGDIRTFNLTLSPH